jgi:hypothetical protein
MATPDLVDIARRPQRYWDIDGLPELIMGLLWMVWGGAWVLGDRMSHHPLIRIYWTFVPALLAFSGFLAVAIIKRLKARLTFPRTGYVEWKEPSLAERLGAAGVAVVTAMVLVMVARTGVRTGQSVAPLLGVIVSLAFVVASLRQRAPHYLALAGVAVTLGLAFGARYAGWESVNWFFMALGAAAAALGGVRLMLFLKKHPRQTPVEP